MIDNLSFQATVTRELTSNAPRSLEEEFVPGTDSQVIGSTFRVYGSIFLVLLFCFCVLRKRYPRLYNVRKWAPGVRCDLAQREYGFLSWMWKVYSTTDDKLLDQCGMDALCFLRILRFGFKISCMGIFNSFWLIPMYVTARTADETANVQDPVEEMTTGHLPIESRRFIGTVIGAYIIFLYSMYLILYEFEWYTEKRHAFLMKRTPRNYAVYVTGIPPEYQSSQLLLEYFQSCFSKSGVLEAHIALDVPALEKLIAQRDTIISKLEHALALRQLRGDAPSHRNMMTVMTGPSELFSHHVERIDEYEAELTGINDEIAEAIRTIQAASRRATSKAHLTEQQELNRSIPLGTSSSRAGNRKRLLSDAMQLFPLEEVRSWGTDKSPVQRLRRRFLSDESRARDEEIGNSSPTRSRKSQVACHDAQKERNMDHGDTLVSFGSPPDFDACIPSADYSFEQYDETPHYAADEQVDGSFEVQSLGLNDDADSIDALEAQPEESITVSNTKQPSLFERLLFRNNNATDTSATAATHLNSSCATHRQMMHNDDDDDSDKKDAIRLWNEAMGLTSPDDLIPTLSQEGNNPGMIFDDDDEELSEILPHSSVTADKPLYEEDDMDDSSPGDDIRKWNEAQVLSGGGSNTAVQHYLKHPDPQDEIHEANVMDDSTPGDAIRKWNEALALSSGGSPANQMLRVNSLRRQSPRKAEQKNQADQEQSSVSSRNGNCTATGSYKPSSSNGNLSSASGSSSSGHHSNPLEQFGSSLKRGGHSLKSAVAESSDHIVKVVTGASTNEIKRQVGGAIKEVNGESILKAADKGVDGIKSVTRLGVKLGVKEIKNITDDCTNAIQNVATTAKSIIVGNEDGAPRDAGFVVFTKLSTTHAALQMIHNSKPYVMDVEEAPDPDDIYYPNVGKSAKSRQIGNLVSFALSGILCLFWTIPVTFISSLTSVDSLRAALPFLSNILDKNPWIEPLLAQLAPLLLIVLNMLLPGILREFAKFEGHIASSALEASVFVKMSAFMIIQTFFVSAISGGITAQLAIMIDDPGSFVDLLANSLPAQGTYFVQILLVATFVGQGLELLRVRPLLFAFIRTRIGPKLTEKERSKSLHEFLRPLSNPAEFEHAEVLANVVLYFMVMFVYAIISPIINYFMAFCFIILGSGYRYQLIHNYPTTPDSGGKMWMGFIGICLTCMVIAQITLVGMLALKKATYATPCLVPLILLTLGFNMYLRIKHFYVTNHLPTRDCLRLDREYHVEKGHNQDFSFVKTKYRQPALGATDEYPEVPQL